MQLNGRHEQRAVAGALGGDLIGGDDLLLRFLDLHRLAELGGRTGLLERQTRDTIPASVDMAARLGWTAPDVGHAIRGGDACPRISSSTTR
jgi:hypothetical protein